MSDFFKGNETPEINPFHTWINSAIEKSVGTEIVAYNFNLYEGGDGIYQIQLIGSNCFDKDDDDWPCSEVFSTGGNVLLTKISKQEMSYDQFLVHAKKMISEYLNNGKYSEKLKSKAAIGMGFTDGELIIVYENTKFNV